MSIQLRPADQRFHGQHGWLDSRHSFSFAEFHDPAHMGFRALRVINDDWIAPGQGFGQHPHRDMEILTYVLEGGVAHKDSTGAEAATRRGEVQRMTAELQRRVSAVAPELVFSIDESIGRSVIQITDSATKEVIRQIPSEDILQINKALERFQQGILLNKQA